MLRRFDASNENVKEMQNNLSSIGLKVDAYALSIKHLEQHMIHLSTTVNLHLHSTLPSNTIQNQKIDEHCMTINTNGIKQTMDQPM